MKYIVMLGDGMADYPVPELGNRTPLEAAVKPNMDFLAQNGKVEGWSGARLPLSQSPPPLKRWTKLLKKEQKKAHLAPPGWGLRGGVADP